jgi:hypothetical protein
MKFILAEWHHARECNQRFGMPTLFQDLNIQFPYQWFGGGCRFDEDAVAWYDARGMFDEHFCEFCNTGISHKQLLCLPQRNRKF